MQIDGGEMDVVGAGVVQKLINRCIQLDDVGNHVLPRDIVGHAHFGFQAQAGQRGAQIVGDARQHDGAVLL